MIVILSAAKNPRIFAFVLAVVLAFVFIRSRQESSSRPEAAHFAAAVERPPHFAVVVVLAFAVVRSFRPPTQRIVISTEAAHSLIVGRVVEKSAVSSLVDATILSPNSSSAALLPTPTKNREPQLFGVGVVLSPLTSQPTSAYS